MDKRQTDRLGRERPKELELRPGSQDHLTGMPNEEWLATNIDAIIAHYGSTLAALYIDGDSMKAINDEHGHSEGDAYIKNMARAILDSVRDGDIGVAVHKSGDEFVVLLGNITTDEALAVIIERIERNLDEIASPVSVGSSRYQDGESSKDFIDRADSALNIRKNERKQGSLSEEQLRAVRMSREALRAVGLSLRAASSFDDLDKK